MALWSVALFGHYKPKDHLGWERRAEPGDIIAIRPVTEHYVWTPTERREFLIVQLDDFDLPQLAGAIEAQWDTNSYPVIPDDAMQKLIEENRTIEVRPRLHVKKRRFHIQLDDLRDMGVDIDKMLDKTLLYSPELEVIKKVKCYDKLKDSYANHTDGFNLLKPLIAGKVM